MKIANEKIQQVFPEEIELVEGNQFSDQQDENWQNFDDFDEMCRVFNEFLKVWTILMIF